jgi:NhaP-type Na+/H+ or K+/H+ antiporter
MTFLAIFIVLIFLHSLISGRLARTVVTPPIVFTVAGFLVYLSLPKALETPLDSELELWLHIAELGLVLLLFTDASRTNLQALNRIRNLPARLLSMGLLLTIFLGGLCALVLFGQLSIWEAGVLGAILAPTDAGLGQIIVNSPRAPLKIREALNVEAGLNDGLAVPFLLFFMALAGHATPGTDVSLAEHIVEQLGYGAMVGLGIGLVGGWLLGAANRRRWIEPVWRPLGVVAIPLLCALASEAVVTSMFIAAFVAGLSVQVGFKQAGKHSVEFAEDWGQFLNLAIFFLFGLMAARASGQFQLVHVLYAVLSLTVVRMLPVAIALIGTRLSLPTVLFMGWFGPRGLASIVLSLVYLGEASHEPNAPVIRTTVMMTVLLSVFAHGLSASPGINRYGRALEKLPSDAPELERVE